MTGAAGSPRARAGAGAPGEPAPAPAAPAPATPRRPGLTTRILHPQGAPRNADGATLPQIAQVSAFAFPSAQEQADVFANRRPGFVYSRVANPTVAAFERTVNQLEGGAATVAYASGMGALSAAFLTLLSAGDALVATPGLYGGTVELLDLLARLGVEVRFAASSAPADVAAAIDATGGRARLAFAETIGNPRLDVADVAGLARAAHERGVPLMVDNTVATPCLVRPIDLGADLVAHSTSKYINGFSDAIGGSLTVSGRFAWDFARYPGLAKFARLGKLAVVAGLRNDVGPALGAAMAPQTAFYMQVGVETLDLRMGRICDSALRLARHLEGLAGAGAVAGLRVRYPGLESHEGHELAARQFGGRFGGILTLRLGSRRRAFALLDSLELASIVSNIGDARTLVVHPATTIAAHLDEDARRASGVYDDLVRVSVGIEDAEDLVADFDQALGRLPALDPDAPPRAGAPAGRGAAAAPGTER
jgi:O-acetylhomoserine (thiol)-lyase